MSSAFTFLLTSVSCASFNVFLFPHGGLWVGLCTGFFLESIFFLGLFYKINWKKLADKVKFWPPGNHLLDNYNLLLGLYICYNR